MAQQQGYLMRLMVPGHRSGITRAVYVYLPPQYFEPGYQAYRFPAIELIHGQPGGPQDWISVVGVTRAFGLLLASHRARPAVLIMPDANGGGQISLQCLDQAGGPPGPAHPAADPPGHGGPAPPGEGAAPAPPGGGAPRPPVGGGPPAAALVDDPAPSPPRAACAPAVTRDSGEWLWPAGPGGWYRARRARPAGRADGRADGAV